ncbi:hypothetical protein BKA62DRAFT_245987 [Auriculariales sp. MPI-PUGE-AT-0066]|nr:hypothetical protein BKA62DRAFT_245987 [Auriculariales sp. MPI-PUGE-AT-0066]
MEADTARYRVLVNKLTESLDAFDDELESLLSKPFEETSAQMANVMEQAKLNVLVPYMVQDLVFIYLKTRGVDPKEHPVVAELERMKQYFAKIKHAEDPEKRRLAIDKEAAGRFIKAAISQAQGQHVSVTSRPVQPDASPASSAEDNSDSDKAAQPPAFDAHQPPENSGKRRRPAYDAFAGYGDTPADSPLAAPFAKRAKLESPASTNFKYAESSTTTKKIRGKEKLPAMASVEAADVSVEEKATAADSDSDDDVLNIVDGGDMVIEDPEPNVDGSWTVVEKAKQKAKEQKEKLGFGKGRRRESGPRTQRKTKREV